MKICVIGLGYIGLPTSVMFALHDVEVIGVDVNPRVIEMLKSGKIHIEEPGLQEAYEKVLKNGKFKASLQPEPADAFIISVPTPNADDEYKSCDMSYVMSSINSILPFLKERNTIIVESTMAPRSMDDYIKPLVQEKGFTIGEDIYLVHCPERVLPGQIMHELIYNNRIVGGITENCTDAGIKVYATFVKGELIRTNARAAEMSKLMENTFRDVNIALANEMIQICNDLEIDGMEVIEMANKHPRVNIHSPGPGVGGHCLAVDPYFIISKSPQKANLINTARQINTSMPNYIVSQVLNLVSNNFGKVTIFGASYKGNVDDIRESPAIKIYNRLLGIGDLTVEIYDPHVNEDYIEKDLQKALDDSDLLLILTDHKEFEDLNIKEINLMKTKQIFDTKNIVKSYPNDVTYITMGNLFDKIKQLTV